MSNPPVGHRITPICTPLHVYQLVMQLLRITFAEAEDYTDGTVFPFKFSTDPGTTNIFITSILDKGAANYGAKPTLLVTRGNVGTQPVVMGDQAQYTMNDSTKTGVTLVQGSVDVKSVSRKPNEVDILGNHIFNFFTSCRSIFPALTSIRRIDNISLSPVAPYEEDDHMFYTQANLSYTMQYKWNWEITPTMLNEIGLFINDELKVEISNE